MRLSLLLLMSGALVIGGAVGASVYCDFYQDIAAGQTFKIVPPNYPNKYPNGADCRWQAVAPTNSKLILNCSEFSLPQSNNCAEDKFSVSLTGDVNMSDAHLYCGTGTLSLQSTSNRITITLTATPFSTRGVFLCSLTATVPPTPKPAACDCGWKKESRIVNGREVGVNEYPMMAGLVDFEIRDIFCGATIISKRYTLTAAHCLLNRVTVTTGVLVGDHDISTGAETNSARLLKTESFRAHPSYNSATQQNDIAVVRVAEDIIFSLEVGPACLPFRFPTTNAGTVVEVLGWGTIEYTGMKSDVLLGTTLDVIDISRCQQVFGSKVSATNQLCTYRSGTDACQADSGGPVFWLGPENRVQLVGVISYSKSCAAQYPGVNTRVYSYLEWILSVTLDAQYCVR